MPYNQTALSDEVGSAIQRQVGQELNKVAEAINRPTFTQLTRYNIESALPAKPRAGMVGMFAAGVAGVNEGIYRYSTGAAWVYVG